VISSFMAGLRATSMIHQSGASVQNNNQSRMALANTAGPNMTFGQIANLLQNAMASLNYEIGYAQQEQAQRMQKKNVEQRQRAIQNGWLA
jgi:hypothetical protein